MQFVHFVVPLTQVVTIVYLKEGIYSGSTDDVFLAYKERVIWLRPAMLTLSALYGNLKPKVDAQPLKSVTLVEKATSDADSANSNCGRGYVNSKNASEKPAVRLQTAVHGKNKESR